jgi:hypothetical protein
LAIRRSSSADAEALLEELRAHLGDDSHLEGTYARLAVIGPRAVSHILRALEVADAPAHTAALLLALERIPDARAVPAILGALSRTEGTPLGDSTVRLAALRAARPLLDVSPEGTAVLDRLTTVVLDERDPDEIRRAAFDALADLPPATLRPLRQRLAKETNPAIKVLARVRRDRTAVEPGADLAALQTQLPSNPDTVLEAVQRAGARAPLSTLHAVLKNVRSVENGSGRRRDDWTAVRGAIHLALARRDSRVALYDLREALESGEGHPLPPDFLAALMLVGDGTCLEPLARAWMNAPRVAIKDRDAAWPRRLRDAFQEVLARQRPSDRKKLLTRIRQRWSAREQGHRLSELLDS